PPPLTPPDFAFTATIVPAAFARPATVPAAVAIVTIPRTVTIPVAWTASIARSITVSGAVPIVTIPRTVTIASSITVTGTVTIARSITVTGTVPVARTVTIAPPSISRAGTIAH